MGSGAAMVIGDEKLLSGKMIVLALYFLKIGLNGWALYQVQVNPELIFSKIRSDGPFIYLSIDHYLNYFSYDLLFLLFGIIGYFLFPRNRWRILVGVIVVSIGAGLFLSGRV